MGGLNQEFKEMQKDRDELLHYFCMDRLCFDTRLVGSWKE